MYISHVHITKACGKQRYIFSALDEGEWSASHPIHSALRKQSSRIHWVVRWVGRRVLQWCREISCLWELNGDSPVVQLVVFVTPNTLSQLPKDCSY